MLLAEIDLLEVLAFQQIPEMQAPAIARAEQDLVALKDACWYSWKELTSSLSALAAWRFEWLLPGHGWPVQLPAEAMNARLHRLVSRMAAE